MWGPSPQARTSSGWGKLCRKKNRLGHSKHRIALSVWRVKTEAGAIHTGSTFRWYD